MRRPEPGPPGNHAVKKTAKPKDAARRARVRVKTARRRSASSTRWLERQLNDPYVAAAADAGYRSRAAFKLRGLDERFHLLQPGQRVLDLGAAPGGWTQVAVERVGGVHSGQVWAVDIDEMEPLPGAATLRLDISAPDAIPRLQDALGGPVDVLLSDMAAPATGHAQTDHLRTMALCEAAFAVAPAMLRPGGSFVAKMLMGGTERELLAALKRQFRSVKHAKPEASRRESSETYIVALGFRPNDADGR